MSQRKDMRVGISIALICVLVIAVLMVVVMAKRNTQYMNVESITETLIDQVAIVKDADGNDVGIGSLLPYLDRMYQISDVRSLGNTARFDYYCYDKDEQLLFVLTDVGNRNLVCVNVAGNPVVY